MLKGYKTEIALTPEQAKKLKQTIGVCRFVYNLFISENTERHKQGLQFMSGASFSKWLNNSYIPLNPDKQWIKDVSSKSVKKSIMNAESAFKKFFTSYAVFPNGNLFDDLDGTSVDVAIVPANCRRGAVKNGLGQHDAFLR